MSKPVIVVHYHELWLKGGNRRFFLGKLFTALRQGLQGIPVERIEQPGDRFLVRLGAEAPLEEAMRRVERVLGVAYYAVARPVERDMEALCRAAWEEVEPLRFANFAVRAKRSDKTFPHTTMEIEPAVGALSAGKAARRRAATSRAAERSRDDVPHRGHAGAVAGLRAKNSRRGRVAGEHRRAHHVPAFRRIRFRRGRVSHDEARRASELRAFLWHGRAAGRIVAACCQRACARAGAVSISSEAYRVPFEANPAGNRALRAGRRAHAASTGE